MTMKWEQLLCKERPRRSTNPGDHRVEFERDYDRTLFSNPVKRLQDKAQVFPLEPHDAIRTRLTHSLEVSTVARGIATKVGKWLFEKNELNDPEMIRSIEAIAATCGLVHDLGNPPFGHSGEDAIREWFGTKNGKEALSPLQDEESCQFVKDFQKFEGNAQTLRLLTKLQILADFNGLNLTYGTLSASCKYIAPSHEIEAEGNHAKSKPGYFASENEVINTIRNRTETGDARNPLTHLVEAADDMVYSVADIEDAVKKDVVSWRVIQDELAKRDCQIIKEALDRMHHILKAGSDKESDNLPDDVYASAFRTSSIAVVVESVVALFKENYDDIMAGKYAGELVKDCEARSLITSLKSIGRNQIYCTQSNLKLELMGRRVICDLMDIFWEGAKELPLDGEPKPKAFAGKAGALLSHNYRRVFRESVNKESSFPERYHRLQLVTDYVCGMTDSFAKRLHAELMNG